jgi:hypothetical protein
MAQKIVIAEGVEIRDVGQGIALLKFLNDKCDPKKGAVSVWTYPKGASAKGITHEVEVVYTMADFAKLSTTTTARGDKPLKGRHFYKIVPRKPAEFETSVQVGSANLDKSSLACKLLFMASCSSHVHFFKPLDKRRKAAKSACKFLMTGFVCATTHAAMFLEQVLIKGHDPISKKGAKAVVKALNGVSDSGIVNIY